jgi:hypothetical protein
MSDIYRVTGIVEHPDGSEYSPLYWGSLPSARLVLDAIVDSALQEGAGFDLALDQGDKLETVCRRYRPVPAPGYSRAAFALVTAGPEYSVLEVSA